MESRAGIGTTGGGTKLPIKDVIRMAAHANHHLAIFDRATGAALDYYRARRTASRAQRIMLIARDGGCTKPCCTVGAYGCQAHHGEADWAAGGNTNVNEMTLACPPDNRLVDDGGYTTTFNDRGEVEWHPPPELDHGQARINYYHRPELLLNPPEDESERERAQGVEPEAQQNPEDESEPERTPDLQWDLDWDLDWGNDFDQPTLIAPNVDHLWDAQSFDKGPFDPGLPSGWILIDPYPWQSSTDQAPGGKRVRGP